MLAAVMRAQELSDQPLNRIPDELGLTRSVYHDWLEKAQGGRLADHVVVPRPCLAALPEEIEAAVAYAKAHPRDYHRLDWMIVDKEIVYPSPSTVYRILDSHDRGHRLHSSPEYLRPVDYYPGNPHALPAERKRKLPEAGAMRREVNSGKKEIRLVNEAPEPERRERAEALAEART